MAGDDPSRPSYVEAPDGGAGAYFLHVVVRGDDLVASMQRARSAERDSLPRKTAMGGGP
jgi:hypothetical protein